MVTFIWILNLLKSWNFCSPNSDSLTEKFQHYSVQHNRIFSNQGNVFFSSPTLEESDAECKEILVDEAAESNSEKRENDRAESVVSSNNNLESTKISMAELELLKKLEEANRCEKISENLI